MNGNGGSEGVDRGISIRPAPGTCCPEMDVTNGVCESCGHEHGDGSTRWQQGVLAFRVLASLWILTTVIMYHVGPTGANDAIFSAVVATAALVILEGERDG